MNEQLIWNFLKGKGLTDIAAAGIMGNLYAESGLVPNNLQQIYNTSLGMTDEEYTRAVDNGSYGNFVRDMAGYGLAQWTFWTRKDGLQKLAKSRGASVGDIGVQLDYLWIELRDFGLAEKLNSCGSVRAASDLMLTEFEKPLDTGSAVREQRARWSQGFYDRFAGKVTEPVPSAPAHHVFRQMYQVVAVARFDDLEYADKQLRAAQDIGMDAFMVEVTA